MRSTSITCLSRIAAALVLGSLAALAGAHEYYLPGITLVHPWGDPSEPGATTAPIYFTVEGVSKADRLVKAAMPLAEKVEFREGPLASAKPLKAISIRPGGPEAFTEGKQYLLLTGLKAPLQWGRSYDMTLWFEKGGPVQVMVSVGAH